MEHPYLVEMKAITKRFPGVVALEDVSFAVKPGEVHVLLGENGAGKSTLMKILSGAYTPTFGEIIIDGKAFGALSPRVSAGNGISIIYQELSVINELSIQENIFVGKQIEKKFGPIHIVDNEAMRIRTEALLAEVGLKYAPSTPVGNLRISEKQMVEIAKAIAFNAKIIIMDEPTSSLTNDEISQLFAIIRKLQSLGKGVIYISHKLKEIMEIGDRVTVLKDGHFVGTHDVKDVTIDRLISMMVGRELQEKYQGAKRERSRRDKAVLEIQNLTRRDGAVRNISFTLYEGEVLGFSGLMASGRTETMEGIYGAVPLRSGRIILDGKPLRIGKTYDALKQGIALVTENRRETGFFHNFSIKRNLYMAVMLKKSRLGGLIGRPDEKEEIGVAKTQQDAMRIKCATVDQNITELSGGNQQKVIVGKWMAADSRVIIFDEPTKGIDVGTKSEIYKLMRALADAGRGVIVVSSELPELLSICDRILVYHEGRINEEFDIADATEEKLAYAAAFAKTGEE